MIDRKNVRVRVASASLEAASMSPATPRAVVVHAGFLDDVARGGEACAIAERLARDAQIASILVALLTPEEERSARAADLVRFEVPMLAQRLAAATDWAAAHPSFGALPIAYAAVGSASAAALVCASARIDVRAVVSRDGRPDLAGAALEKVRAPTLLLVRDDDDELVSLNRSARTRLRGESEIALVDRDESVTRAVDFLVRRLR